ncbi:MAG: hypothetical protein FWE89_00370 [Syntrophaceae bacterium]|nr:hypothetical protein [Syntrophaceae bacterium]
MDWRELPLEQMIPHRGRMRLIDRVLSLDDERSVTEAIPRPDWPLHSEGSVDCLVTIELVAQTAALLEGWKRQRAGRGSASGYLVGIKSAKLLSPRLPVTFPLVTEVTRGYGLEGYAVFQGTVLSNGKVVAQVQVQTIRQEEGESSDRGVAEKE